MVLENVVLLNTLEFTNKKTNEKGLKIGYYIADPKSKEDNIVFSGLHDFAYFTNDLEIRKKIPLELYGNICSLIFEEKISPMNPLKKTSVLVGIKSAKHGDINLL